MTPAVGSAESSMIATTGCHTGLPERTEKTRKVPAILKENTRQEVTLRYKLSQCTKTTKPLEPERLLAECTPTH